MRKDADFAVDARINIHFQSESEDMKNLILEFSEFLQDEALALSITDSSCDGDAQVSVFESENGNVTFGVKVA